MPVTALAEKVQMFSASCNLLLANMSTLEKEIYFNNGNFRGFCAANMVLLLYILARTCILRVSIQN